MSNNHNRVPNCGLAAFSLLLSTILHSSSSAHAIKFSNPNANGRKTIKMELLLQISELVLRSELSGVGPVFIFRVLPIESQCIKLSLERRADS